MAKYTPDDEKSGMRKALMDYMNKDTYHTYNQKAKFLDVTGSLGCWGIVQLDNNGNIER